MSQDDEYLSIEKRPPETLIRRLLTHAAGEYGTPHGQMMLRGELTKSQYAACKWFDELYDRYLKAIGHSRGIRTSTGERVEAGHAPDPFSPIGWEIAADEQEAVKKFKAARKAALVFGMHVFWPFWLTVIDGREIGDRGSSYDLKVAVKNVANELDKHRSRGWKSRRKK